MRLRTSPRALLKRTLEDTESVGPAPGALAQKLGELGWLAQFSGRRRHFVLVAERTPARFCVK